MTKQDVINGIVRAIRQAEADDVGNGLPNWAEIRADRIRQWDIALGLVRDIDDVQPQPQPQQERPQDDHRLDAFRYANLPMIQKGKEGLIYPCPMPAQQEPSVLEVALRILGQGTGMNATECVGYAFALIDAVRAEEARRAGR